MFNSVWSSSDKPSAAQKHSAPVLQCHCFCWAHWNQYPSLGPRLHTKLDLITLSHLFIEHKHKQTLPHTRARSASLERAAGNFHQSLGETSFFVRNIGNRKLFKMFLNQLECRRFGQPIGHIWPRSNRQKMLQNSIYGNCCNTTLHKLMRKCRHLNHYLSKQCPNEFNGLSH